MIEYQQWSLGIELNLVILFCVQECCTYKEWGEIRKHRCNQPDLQIPGNGQRICIPLPFIQLMLLEDGNTVFINQSKHLPHYVVWGWWILIINDLKTQKYKISLNWIRNLLWSYFDICSFSTLLHMRLEPMSLERVENTCFHPFQVNLDYKQTVYAVQLPSTTVVQRGLATVIVIQFNVFGVYIHYTHTLVWVATRSQHWVTSSITCHLILRQGLLILLNLSDLVKWAGQGVPGISLSLPFQYW